MIYGKEAVAKKFDEFDNNDETGPQIVARVINFFVVRDKMTEAQYYKDIYEISNVCYKHIEKKYGPPSLLDSMRDKYDL